MTRRFAILWLLGMVMQGNLLSLKWGRFLFFSNTLQAIGIGFFSIIFGLVFLTLGVFVKRMSPTALIIAIVIFALDAIFGLVLSVMAGINPNIGGLLARVFFIIPMIKGVPAIRTLKQ